MKSTIRPATQLDIEDLYGFAITYASEYPKRRIDYERAYSMLKQIVGSGKHYAMVVEVNDKIQGALLAVSSENLWAEGESCQIVFWVSRVPGDGRQLLRRFKKWAMGRRSTITVAGFCPDLPVDPRAWALAERVGFKKSGGSYLHHN